MNEIDAQHLSRHAARRARKKNRDDALQQSSKLGYVIIGACVLIMTLAFVFTQQVDARATPQPEKIPADSVKASSLSTSWICPISGSAASADSILLSNPDFDRSANVQVVSYDPAGNVTGKTELKIEPSATKEIGLNILGSNDASSILVDSFSGSIVVFRSMTLSDGVELLPCINNFSSQAVFPNLETIRNSNSIIVLANPYDEAVVVDVVGTLTDTSINPPISVLDEIRGVIIPAHGRVNLDLQSEFGRYGLVSVAVNSRSGFFGAEAFLSFTGGESVQGQTVVSAAPDISSSKNQSWVGVAPTRVVARNDSQHSFSLGITALASDKRSINGEPQVISPFTTSTLNNIGSDFLTRTMTLAIEDSSNKPNNIFASWIHASGNAVSSGSTNHQGSLRALALVNNQDNLFIYNPNREKATIAIQILGSNNKKEITLDGLLYTAVPLNFLALQSDSVLEVTSTQKIVSAVGDSKMTHYSQTVDIRP